MKSSQFSKLMMLVLALTLVASAFAGGDSHKGNFLVSGPVEVNGQQLPAGEYVAKWDGDGPDVQVNITQNGKTLATVPAKVVQLDQKASENSTEVINGSGGSGQLSSVRFGGKKYSLQMNAASIPSAAGTQ